MCVLNNYQIEKGGWLGVASGLCGKRVGKLQPMDWLVKVLFGC